MKDFGLGIRVERELREQFLRACRAQDKPAAQVLSDFMREFVSKQSVLSPWIESELRINFCNLLECHWNGKSPWPLPVAPQVEGVAEDMPGKSPDWLLYWVAKPRE